MTAPDAELAGPPSPAGPIILLADDDPDVLQATAQLLRDCGYAVLSAQSALEAAMVSAQCPGPIDLLLTDFDLGSNLGTELVSLLQIVRPSLRVLITSGHPDLGGTLVVKDRQFTCLQKPFTKDQLVTRIAEVMADWR
jgi:two-component system cell cycle sensor histidine kinase/response regulator CckA